MLRFLTVLFCCSFIAACNMNTNKAGNSTPGKYSKVDLAKAELEQSKERLKANDTITKGGKSISFTLNDKKEVIMTWSKGNFKRTYNCGEEFGAYSPPWFKIEWSYYIGMRAGCGTGCWNLTVFPMNYKDSIVTYTRDLSYDTARNLILYPDTDEHKLIVENIRTHNKQEIILPKSFSHDTYSYIYLSFLDSISFSEKGLFIRWVTSGDAQAKDRKMESKVYPLNKLIIK